MKKGITPPRPRPARLGGLDFEFIGGALVLDFNNTVAWPQGRKSNERLRRPVDLIRWSEEVGLITAREARKLRAFSLRNPIRSRLILEGAIHLRDVLHELQFDLTDDAVPDAQRLGELNRWLRKARASEAVVWRSGRLQWVPGKPARMATILDRLVCRAGDLLTSDDVLKLRHCANPDCGWLFIDRTKNGTRRWCSMPECGDRAKSRRYYERKKAEAG